MINGATPSRLLVECLRLADPCAVYPSLIHQKTHVYTREDAQQQQVLCHHALPLLLLLLLLPLVAPFVVTAADAALSPTTTLMWVKQEQNGASGGYVLRSVHVHSKAAHSEPHDGTDDGGRRPL
jgi:hypothetical protein